MDTTRHTTLGVEADVVLHGAEVRQPEGDLLARCQFSLNQPRLSPCTGRSKTMSPGMLVLVTLSSFSNSIALLSEDTKPFS